MNQQILERHFLGNAILNWIVAAGIITAGVVIVRLIGYFVVRKLKIWAAHTRVKWDDYVIMAIQKSLIPVFYFSVIYSALNTLYFSAVIKKWIYAAFLAVVAFYVLSMISNVFKKLVHLFIKGQGAPAEKEKQASGLILIVNGVIWMLGIIFFINNLGYNVTTLIAGIGIGGIALALAAQTILGDLFSYFVIFFDRPFEIGDFITVDNESGVVEHIGIKTTRIRTLSGEQLICSNTNLTNARVHNYKRLMKRRVVFSLGVTYQTSHALLSEIPLIVKEIIGRTDLVDFDRGHFAAYDASSLKFEFVYYVTTPDYNTYMDRQQEIYLNIFKAFEMRRIEFAYPTQTLFVSGN